MADQRSIRVSSSSATSLPRSFSSVRSSRRDHLTVFFALISIATVALSGCASVSTPSSSSSSTQTASTTNLSPSSASIQVWQNLQFSVTGSSASDCTWASSNSSILASLGNGQFQGTQTGTTKVTVTCGTSSASASVVISAQQQSAPVVISSGGTYSGNWVSDDPSVPAVTIKTTQPVVLQDSVISSRGDLIQISGSGNGANVTVKNVTGTALDPQVSGQSRGSFITGTSVASLAVKNCSMTGVSFGVKLASSSVSSLQILDNEATDLEDRASDGNGGLLSTRPVFGHFVLLNHVTAANGAEIAWNKISQTIGSSSVEDTFNIYSSQGTASQPIWLHDNYMEGASSPSNPTDYSGVGIITDGTTANGNQPTAYVLFENNQIVATAGGGVAIAAGHDIQGKNNRIVSCGVTVGGSWYAHTAVGAYIWNYYSSSAFYNNSITSTAGGMVNPSASDAAIAHDLWVNPTDASLPGISATGNDFTDPCITSDGIDLQAEANERTLWEQKVASSAQLIGDQHMN